MKENKMMLRRLLAAMLALFSLSAHGQSMHAISAYMGLFIDTVVDQEKILCAARLPDTADQWKTAVQKWKSINAQQLTELQKAATAIETTARIHALDPSSKDSERDRATHLTAFRMFMMLATSKPATELARANDKLANDLCQNWLASIAENGPLQMDLPNAIASAKGLLRAEMERHR
jgi:hypothetical protein